MMFVKYAALKKPAKILAAIFASVSMTSFGQYEDPSLLAAPVYEPEKWNDVSYEGLKAFYKQHGSAIERIIATTYEKKQLDPGIVFRRKAQSQVEKTISVLALLHQYMETNKQFSVPELANAGVSIYHVERLEMLSIMFDTKDIYHPRGIQQTNNCFAYAVNDADKSFDAKDYQANPGDRARGARKQEIDTRLARNYNAFVRQTIEGSIRDGMIYTGDKMATREGFYRVALFTRPIGKDVSKPEEAMDFHYVRQDRNGRWSHKFGALTVTNLDYSEQPITDPRKADMGAYWFIGFFLVPKGGIDVGPPKKEETKTASRPALQAG